MLKAQAASGELIGQVRVSKGGEIATVSLVPPDAAPPPAVLDGDRRGRPDRARPRVAVHERARRLRRPGDPRGASGRRGPQRVYVANLREQLPETAGFDVARARSPRCERTRSRSTSCSPTGRAPARRAARRRQARRRGPRHGGIPRARSRSGSASSSPYCFPDGCLRCSRRVRKSVSALAGREAAARERLRGR